MNKLSFLALILMVLISCQPSQKATTTTADQILLEKLQAVPDTCFLFGQHDAPMYGIGWFGDEDRSDVKSVCGSYPAMMSFDLGGLELGNDRNLDSVSFERMRKEIVKQDARGGLVTLSWHLRNPKTGGDAWDTSDTTVVHSILYDTALHEKFLEWLDNLAYFLNSILREDGSKIGMIFRPWHEHTGSWFWWGQKLCSAEDYQALWKLTVEHLKERGVDQLLYAYSPGTEPKTAEAYLERYPGDDIISIFGVDGYQFDHDSYVANLDASLTLIEGLAKECGKIPALTETGFEGIKEADWWTQTLLPILKRHQLAYLVVWRNAFNKPGHFYGPYPGCLSEEDFVKFFQEGSAMFVKDSSEK